MALNRYQQQLRDQLLSLVISCNAFDRGLLSEANRIATTIRVLVHHTQNSISLLTHLAAQNINLLSTSATNVSSNLHPFSGLTLLRTGSVVDLVPKLGMGIKNIIIPVAPWWKQIVLIRDGNLFSRKNIVLTAANQDGGAHVDANLDSGYGRLKSEAFWHVIHQTDQCTSQSEIKNPQTPALRQMAYEILHSPELFDLLGSDISSILQVAVDVDRTALQICPPEVQELHIRILVGSEDVTIEDVRTVRTQIPSSNQAMVVHFDELIKQFEIRDNAKC